MGSVVKKRRKKIAKHKYKKLLKRTRHQRRSKWGPRHARGRVPCGERAPRCVPT